MAPVGRRIPGSSSSSKLQPINMFKLMILDIAFLHVNTSIPFLPPDGPKNSATYCIGQTGNLLSWLDN